MLITSIFDALLLQHQQPNLTIVMDDHHGIQTAMNINDDMNKKSVILGYLFLNNAYI